MLGKDSAKMLRDSLRVLDVSAYGRVLEHYFGALYSKGFADWVVFIGKSADGKTDTVKQALIVDGEFTADNDVRGQHALSLVLFSETDLAKEPDSVELARTKEKKRVKLLAMGELCKQAGVQCTIALTTGGEDAGGGGSSASKAALKWFRATLQYTGDPTITTLLKAIGKDFGGGATSAAQAVPDSMLTVSLQNVALSGVGTDTSSHLYVGLARMALPTNSLARYTLHPDADGFAMPNASGVGRSISNASESRLGVSVAVGATFDARDTVFKAGTLTPDSISPWAKPNVWLLGHYYLVRPSLPLRPGSVSLVLGTNIGTDLLHDFLVGLSLDRLVGEAGIVGGVNFVAHKTATSVTETRVGRIFGGITFAL